MKPFFTLRLVALFLLVVCSRQAHAADTSRPRSTPEAQGIPSAAVRAFIERADAQIHTLHSFMPVRHGQVIAITAQTGQMQTELDLVWDKPLPADPAEYAKLQQGRPI